MQWTDNLSGLLQMSIQLCSSLKSILQTRFRQTIGHIVGADCDCDSCRQDFGRSVNAFPDEFDEGGGIAIYDGPLLVGERRLGVFLKVDDVDMRFGVIVGGERELAQVISAIALLAGGHICNL